MPTLTETTKYTPLLYEAPAAQWEKVPLSSLLYAPPFHPPTSTTPKGPLARAAVEIRAVMSTAARSMRLNMIAPRPIEQRKVMVVVVEKQAAASGKWRYERSVVRVGLSAAN